MAYRVLALDGGGIRGPRIFADDTVFDLLGHVDRLVIADYRNKALHEALTEQFGAAPTYFPTWQGYIDGGVAANNPSVCGLAQALDPATGGQRLEDVVLLSLGTGASPRRIEGDDHDWGLAEWAPNLVGIMLDGVAGVADFQCRQILGPRYHRVDVVLPRAVGMDEHRAIPELDALGESADTAPAVAWLAEHFARSEDEPAA